MFIQGNLQVVFDALYELGMIDPVLKMDWHVLNDEIVKAPEKLNHVIEEVNTCAGDISKLKAKFYNMDTELLNYLAMEVAREMADYYECKNIH